LFAAAIYANIAHTFGQPGVWGAVLPAA